MARRKIAAGNWKMNTHLSEGISLASAIVERMAEEVPSDVQLVLNAPFIHLTSLRGMMPSDRPNLFLGAQNCSDKASGAYTGEVSVSMLKSVPVDFTIVGHSERREYFQESNAQLAQKMDLLLEQEISPIFCCGEPLNIREAGTHVEYVKTQVSESLFHLTAAQMEHIVIAYEPIWAIGTGVTASAAQAQDMHAAIRAHLAEKFGPSVAEETSILYGGSVKPNNAAELFAGADVDGGLIGGASLKVEDFIAIAKSF